jgi:hypothetical protein
MLGEFQSLVTIVLFVVFLIVKVWALADCATRPKDAFPAAGRKSWLLWLAITGASAVTGLVFSPLGIFGLAGLVASIVYLVDVRPRVAEAASWRR